MSNLKLFFSAAKGAFLVLFAASSCTYKNNPGKKTNFDTVRILELAFNMPLDNVNGEFRNKTDSFLILHKSDFYLYRFERPNIAIIDETTGDTVIGFPTKPEYNYFIYRERDTFGYRYHPQSLLPPGRMDVDSFLTRSAFRHLKIFDQGLDSLINSNKSDSTWTETYVPKIKPDISYNDTSIFYLRNYHPDIGFSISRELEKLREWKVYKARLIYNPSGNLPKRELWFELKPVPSDVAHDVNSILEKLKNELYLQ